MVALDSPCAFLDHVEMAVLTELMLFWLRRCEAFAARGCTVYASARRLESMSDFKHSTVTPVQLDVTKDEDVRRVIEMIIDQHGRIDVVVNNAGVLAISVCPFLFSDANVVVIDQCSLTGPLADIPMNQFVDAYDTNVFGPVRVAKAVIPHMAAKRSGTIVNIGSVVGEAYVFSLTSFHAYTHTQPPPQSHTVERSVRLHQSQPQVVVGGAGDGMRAVRYLRDARRAWRRQVQHRHEQPGQVLASSG